MCVCVRAWVRACVGARVCLCVCVWSHGRYLVHNAIDRVFLHPSPIPQHFLGSDIVFQRRFACDVYLGLGVFLPRFFKA